MTNLELGDIQGNILRGYRSTRAAYLFFGCDTAAAGRAFLAQVVDLVRDAESWGNQPPATAVNVAVTFDGLTALGVDPSVLGKLPDAFRQPVAERAATLLDDRDLGDPTRWEHGLGTGAAHLLVTVNQLGPDAAAFDAAVQRTKDLAGAGVRLVHEQVAEALEHRREHFGWADGFGQPAVEGAGPDDGDDTAGGGSPQADGSWTRVRAGEFIHGYPDEDDQTTDGPTAALLRNGTFMVYRKLHQDLVGFRDRLRADALAYGRTLPDEPPLDEDQLYELAAAKVVGRWRDGMPIEDAERRPLGTDVHLGGKELDQPNNDFRYGAGDLDGGVCPVGAHIRRTNPRDALGWEGGSQMTSTHRIIRRGMPYGPFKPYEKGEVDDGVDRGLIFVCFNASIERQFEVVQRQWCNDGNAFGLGDEKDYVLGDHLNDPVSGAPGPVPQADGRTGCPHFSVQRGDGAPFALTQGRPLVWTRGTEYLLMPGISVLRQLADGRLDPAVPLVDEAVAIDEVVRLSEVSLEKGFPAGSGHVGRDQHAKAHGTVHARFEVHGDLPDELRVGLFAQARAYDAWIRFSSRASDHRPASDTKADAHGMAVKVIGVDGPKLLVDERDATTQDFVLANAPTFFSRDAIEYVELATAVGRGAAGLLRFAIPSVDPRRWRIGRVLSIRRAVGQDVGNPLQIRYWSQTPYALGPLAVKYSATPQVTSGAVTKRVHALDGLEEAMSAQLEGGDVVFDFMVQRQGDPAAMPIDDPTVRWDEAASPFVTVATVRIPAQAFGSEARRALGDALSFTPWHALAVHEPLGAINRTRRDVYEAISIERHSRNGLQRSEPTTLDDV